MNSMMKRSLRYLTWLDVKREIRQRTNDSYNLPKGVVYIDCFSDGITVGVQNLNEVNLVSNTLQEWFGDWYRDQGVQLDLGDVNLPIEFVESTGRKKNGRSLRPSWEMVNYLEPESQLSTSLPWLPQPFEDDGPEISVFYSFKGGVGRTLHLAAHLLALMEAARVAGQAIKVLVIDADLEAPGLTYWDRNSDYDSSLSFLDFLEAYHYSPLETEETLALLAKEIQKSPRIEGKSTYYFMPACLDDSQLLDKPILPEHLSRGARGAWTCVDAVRQLGKQLKVDYILMDLRAGLSEIASPFIFDPRIQRYFVTPVSEQSIAGITLALRQLNHIKLSDKDIADEKYYDPSVIISLLTEDLRRSQAFENALEQLNSAYGQFAEVTEDLRVLKIHESNFAQELMVINSWAEASEKLPGTLVFKLGQEWASARLHSIEKEPANKNSPRLLPAVQNLRDVCRQYEFAEAGEGEDLLITPSLKNLATAFSEQLPMAISIGSKGAGKTFTYLQIARSQVWEKFIERVLGSADSNDSSPTHTYIFPLMQSRNLQPVAQKIVNECQGFAYQALKVEQSQFVYSQCIDRINESLGNEIMTERDWNQFWVEEVAHSIGVDQDSSWSDIHNSLESRGLRFVFLFDGLEDIFQNVSGDRQHQLALKALIDVPRRLQEIRQAAIGVVIFLRRDFLGYVVPQNLSQLESLYRKYDLSWNMNYFLRLSLWISVQAKVINISPSELDSLSSEQISEKLEVLWGKKLGSEKSNEAHTERWIFGALTDFKGRLQARDIVRILYNAAAITVDDSKTVQFELWSRSRLLPPKSIRRALEPCSKEKVKEMCEEYPSFKEWVEQITKLPQDQKHVPFTLKDLPMLETDTIQMLEETGVIYGSTEPKDGVLRYYMPEIFRAGLGFSLGNGARPRVIALKRKALGIGVS